MSPCMWTGRVDTIRSEAAQPGAPVVGSDLVLQRTRIHGRLRPVQPFRQCAATQQPPVRRHRWRISFALSA